MSNDQITNILTVILFVMIGILFILFCTYIILKVKEKRRKNKRMAVDNDMQKNQNKKEIPEVKQLTDYTKQSIYSFMNFDKIQDNMIISKKRKKICNGNRMSGN
ncbi:MAG: hypothetical protein IKF97_01420 [Clostridia bacterium]|nr:hypothetical protein [Clostridia bacterium]